MNATPDRRGKAFRERVDRLAAEKVVIKVSPSLAADVFAFAGTADLKQTRENAADHQLENCYTVYQLRHSNAILRRLALEAKANLQYQLRLNKVLDAQLRQKDAQIEQLTSKVYALSDQLCRSAAASTRALASQNLPETKKRQEPSRQRSAIVHSQLQLSQALDEASDRARHYQNAALKGQLMIQELEDKLLKSKMEASLLSLQNERYSGSGIFCETQTRFYGPPDRKYSETKVDL